MSEQKYIEFWIMTPDGLSPTGRTEVFSSDPKLLEVYDRKIYRVVEYSTFQAAQDKIQQLEKQIGIYRKALDSEVCTCHTIINGVRTNICNKCEAFKDAEAVK